MKRYVLRLARGTVALAAFTGVGCSQSPGPGGGPNEASVVRDAAPDGEGDGSSEDATDGSTDGPAATLDGGDDSPGDASGDASEDASVDAPAFVGPTCNQPCNHGTCLPSGGCECDPDWAGSVCDMAAPALSTDGGSVAGSVTRGNWEYFTYYGPASGLSATITENSSVGLVWVYLGAGAQPSSSSNIASDEAASASHTVSHTFA